MKCSNCERCAEALYRINSRISGAYVAKNMGISPWDVITLNQQLGEIIKQLRQGEAK
jgi:hypothetical protein